MDLIAIADRVRNRETPLGVAEGEVLSYGTLSDDERELLGFDIRVLMEDLSGTSGDEAFALARLIAVSAGLLGDDDVHAAICLTTASALMTMHEPQTALATVAQTVFPDNVRRELLMERDEIFVRAWRAIGRSANAETAALKMMADYDDLLGRARRAFLWSEIGFARADLSRYTDAIAAAETALMLETAPAFVSAVRMCIGRWARSAGDFDRALAEFAEARRLRENETPPDVDGAAYALSEAGITWSQMGENDRATEILAEAAAMAEEAGDHEAAERWRAKFERLDLDDETMASKGPWQVGVMAASALRKEPPDYDAAERLAKIAIAGFIELRSKLGEAETRNTLSVAYAGRGEIGRAVATARLAAQRAAEAGSQALRFRILANVGLYWVHANRPDYAEPALREAIEVGTNELTSTATTEIRQSIKTSLDTAFNELAKVFLFAGDEPRAADLLELGQRGRATNLASWLAAQAAVESAGAADLVEPLLAWRSSEVAVESEAISAPTQIAPTLARQAAARDRFRTAAATRGLSAAFQAPAFTAGEIVQALTPGESLVDLFCTKEGVAVTAVGDAGVTASFVKWPAAERIAFATMLQDAMAAPISVPRRGHVSGAEQRGPAQKQTVVPSSEGFDRLVAAIAAKAREVSAAEHVIVIPHDELAHLPFWAVAREQPNVALSLCHGANALVLLRRRHRDRAGARVAVGDATGSLTYARPEIAALPGFEAEQPDKAAILGRFASASMIHFAGHGLFNARRPYESGLFVRGQGVPYDQLTVIDVMRANAPLCYLAVLSACCSGLPRLHAANEFVGLPAALLIAGARNVVATLWPVDDRVAFLMMQEFYAALLNGGLPPSRALAAARSRVATMSYEEVTGRLGSETFVPLQPRPYAAPEHSSVFQHFGAD